MAENENSLWNFTPKTNSRNDWFNELNRMQANFMGAPQPMQQQQQMPNFGDGGVELQRLRNEGLQMGLQQLALRGAGKDINGWPLAAGPNPNPWAANNQFAGAHERSRAVADAQRAQWAATPQRASIFAGLRGETPAVANPFLQYHLSHWQPPTHPQPFNRMDWTPQIDYRQMSALPVGPMGARAADGTDTVPFMHPQYGPAQSNSDFWSMAR